MTRQNKLSFPTQQPPFSRRLLCVNKGVKRKVGLSSIVVHITHCILFLYSAYSTFSFTALTKRTIIITESMRPIIPWLVCLALICEKCSDAGKTGVFGGCRRGWFYWVLLFLVLENASFGVVAFSLNIDVCILFSINRIHMNIPLIDHYKSIHTPSS